MKGEPGKAQAEIDAKVAMLGAQAAKFAAEVAKVEAQSDCRLSVTQIEEVDAGSQALVYSQQVAAGAKLAAQMMVHRGLAEVVSEWVTRAGCKTVVTSEGDWEIITIYKYPFVRVLLEEMEARRTGDPPSLLDVWSSGKLFGYSDYEIAGFLEDNGYMQSPLMLSSHAAATVDDILAVHS